MKRTLKERLRDVSGQSLVELAGALVFFVVPLTLALVDFSCAINAHNAIVNMSREGANLASRSMLISQGQGPQMIMNSIAGTAAGLDMKSNGMMYLTQVQGVGGVPSITSQTAWAERQDGPPSAVDETTLPSVLGKVAVGERDTVWIFEVFYQYQSLFPVGNEHMHGFRPQLHTVAIFAGGSR